MGMFHTTDLNKKVLRRTTVRVPGSRRALLQPAEYDLFASRFTTFAIQVLNSVLSSKPLRPAGKPATLPDGEHLGVEVRQQIEAIVGILRTGGAYE